MNKLLLAVATVALVAAAPAPTPAPAPAPQPVDPAVVLETIITKICQLGPDKAEPIIQALPEKQRVPVLMICIAYEQGRADAKPAALPTGGTQI